MWQSLRVSHLILRLTCALYFLWVSVDSFFHASSWLNKLPPKLLNLTGLFHVSPVLTLDLLAVLGILVGLSLVLNVFSEAFSLLGLIIIITITLFYGFSEAAIGALGLIGGLAALTLWPSSSFRRY